MKLDEFLTVFINKLDSAGISHCVLRNYEGLPILNYGNDIDFLIKSGHVNSVVKIISNVEGVNVTGFVNRPYVISVFIHGVVWEGGKAIQIDLFTSLSWKGLAYIDVDKVLSVCEYISPRNKLIKKTSIEYEVINSFFGSYLIGGWIKEKYQLNVRNVFLSSQASVIEVLRVFLSVKTADNLIGAVIDDDRNILMGLLPKVKRELLVKRFSDNPLQALKAMLIYYFYEVKIRITPSSIDSICLLGCDGAGKSAVINGLLPELKNTTKQISVVHLKPKLRKDNAPSSLPVSDPHGTENRCAIVSFMKLLLWTFLYWRDYFFHGHKNLTLRIWDRYYYDVYIDPKRYRYGAPLWLAKLIGKFIPKPGLIIILDASAEIIQGRKQEVSLEETRRQREAYLKFARETPGTVVLDTGQSFELTINDGVQAILSYMQNKQKSRMNLNVTK